MTEIETIIRTRLDRRYPAPTAKPDWDAVLQRAVRAEQPRVTRAGHVLTPRSLGRRIVLGFVAVALATAAATLVLVAPWNGGPTFTEQALAALGSGRYVHAVFQGPWPYIRIVSLRSGRTQSAVERIEWVYDTKSSTLEWVASLNGVAQASDRNGISDPAVTDFADGYRSALANGKGRVIGETSVNGQRAKIIRLPISGSGGPVLWYEDVLVSTDSHRPIMIHYRTAPQPLPQVNESLTYRVVSIDSSDARQKLSTPQPLPSLDGTVTIIRKLDPSETATALRHTALWPGQTIAGATLQAVQLQRLTTSVINSHPPRSINGLGLALDYRATTGSLVIQEATTPQYPYGFYDTARGTSGPLPDVGKASLTSPDPTQPTSTQNAWQAQLRKNGLYITIRSPNKSLVISAARALTPMH